MNSEEKLYTYLVCQFPEFSHQWDSDENYNKFDDGTFTLCGLCAEFSQYYVDSFDSINRHMLVDFFDKIETILDSSDSEVAYLDLANPLKSCFLENIARTAAGEKSKPLMGNHTRRFFDEWHISS
ncbi:hypothetical protein RN22_24250 [Grimontia sp. AD028]|uniref:DUF7674 family protein n=1 Tax=Grimontia sp. AD028 TaxID=1581149 RepID=UPI00061A9530|nr:hypothetical protein [Grimontia sp. AD028]KKD57842.1 hypothetical protein RN22_24250 [Grimontia sp. AD028]